MLRDIRGSDTYREALALREAVFQPGGGRISDAAQMQVTPDLSHVVFVAVVAERADAEPRTRLAITELATGRTSFLTQGPGNERLPQISPDGTAIAYLADGASPNLFQLHILDRASGAVRAPPALKGGVDYLAWSPDGRRILLGSAGPRAAAPHTDEPPPSWAPRIDPDAGRGDWRDCWIFECATGALSRVETGDCCVWAAAWQGDDALCLLASQRPGEGQWYAAELRLLDLATGGQSPLYQPRDQLSAPVPSPSGRALAVVEALCSDRGPVIGDLILVDVPSGEARRAETGGVDIVNVVWRSDQQVLVSGFRGLETVVGVYHRAKSSFQEIWASTELSVVGACLAPLAEPSSVAMILEGFATAPLLAVLRDGQLRTVTSFDLGYGQAMDQIVEVSPVGWPAPDGLLIEGWLLRPPGAGPHPLILNIHGGPVGHWRPTFLPRRLLHVPILLAHGLAVFLPNPRGSTGRGQDFVRPVMGDIGGADGADLMAGVEWLVSQGIADPQRLGVTGVSYGGFMTAWLVTQSDRFAAAAAVSPHTNQTTAHLLSNIPEFMADLVGGDMGDPLGPYFARSPVLKVQGRCAPTLNICGGLDRCTPPGEAVQFHNALLEAGGRSVLVTYPNEGHGIRGLPAATDCAARVAGWLIEQLAAEHA